MQARVLAALALAALVAGCAEAPVHGSVGADGESWLLHGTFTPERTQADIDAWCAIARDTGNECALMESFPEQFGMRFATEAACQAARARIVEIAEARPGECRRVASPAKDPDEPASSAPTRELAVHRFELTWSDGGERQHDMAWDVVRAWSENGVVTVNTTTQGIEGGDFRFRLWFRPHADGAPARPLVHAPGAPEAGTFDFAYTEAVFWSGRPIDVVDAVAPRSSVTIIEHDDSRGVLRGQMLLDFTGHCTGAFNCAEPEASHRTVIDARFGP